MASLIKETPVLTGQDAFRFLEKVKNPKPVIRQETEQMKKNVEWLRSIRKKSKDF